MKQSMKRAAHDYATHKTKFRKDVLNEVDSDNYDSRHSDCMEDFQSGVEWQRKQWPICEIDLNDIVSVELTDWGATYLNALNTFNNTTYRYSHPNKTEYKAGDVYQNNLWLLIQEFKGSNRFDKNHPFCKLKKIIE